MEDTSNTRKQTSQMQKIRIIQHNCARSQYIMQSILDSATGTADIIMLQEPWTYENKTLSNANFDRIMPQTKEHTYRPRVVTFIAKNLQIKATPRSDLIADPDAQAIFIQGEVLNKEVLLINIYNEKSQVLEDETKTVDRVLASESLQKRDTLIAGDFNAHHSWWNSRINNPIRASTIVRWAEDNDCDLVNEPDEITRANGTSQSIIDLAFASQSIIADIVNWHIDYDAATGSDHEVIRFDLLTSQVELVDNPMNAPYNLAKANWEEFDKYLCDNSELWLGKIANANLEQKAVLLTEFLQKAISGNIPKRKMCPRSKVWWNDELTKLRQQYSHIRRQWKKSQQDWSIVANTRNIYHDAIKNAKTQCWRKFLANAKGKEMFKAYKYTKPRMVEKLPPIKSDNNQVAVTFDDKCQAFLKAMYPKPPECRQSEQINYAPIPWISTTAAEVESAIMTSAPNKAPGPDVISFAILQKAYKSIPKIFNLVFCANIDAGYHPKCWRQGTGVILPKPGKDHTIPKGYRIITLLNCLAKVSEKIIATRLSYLAENPCQHANTQVLDNHQMGGRKQRSAIDAVMNLVHDAQIAYNNGNTLTCLMMDVKGAFDHVSLEQLIRILKKLRIPENIITWVQCFLSERVMSLAFDGEKQTPKKVVTGIPQGSPISPILFLIYIRYLFPKLRAKYIGLETPSYIDDVALCIEGKDRKKNIDLLQKVAKVAFNWAESNTVKFDDDKSELIHFTKSRKEPDECLQLPNGTTIAPKKVVKWLGIYLDRKLNFQHHIREKINVATRTLHAIMRLLSSEWGLDAKAGRHLYLACVTSVSDYGAEIWFNEQKNYIQKFQRLQNTALKKILGTFKTSPTQAMQIEAEVLPPELRLRQKCNNYALRLTTLAENHPTRRRLPRTYPPGYETGDDTFDDNLKWLDWDESNNNCSTCKNSFSGSCKKCKKSKERTRNHPTQLLRVIHGVSGLLNHDTNIEVSQHTPPWQPRIKDRADVEILKPGKIDADEAATQHWELKKLLCLSPTTTICYTDASRIRKEKDKPKRVGFGVYFAKSKNAQSCKGALSKEITVKDAELKAIDKAMQACEEEPNGQEVWIFTDSMDAIRAMQKQSANEQIRQIEHRIENLKAKRCKIYIRWIPSKRSILGNEKADKMAKEAALFDARTSSRESEITTVSFLKHQVKKQIMQLWAQKWNECESKGKHYQKFHTMPKTSKKRKNISTGILQNIDRLIFSTFMQLKMGHGYFRSYLVRLSNNNSAKCINGCRSRQTPEHIMLDCKHYRDEQRALRDLVKATSERAMMQWLFTSAEGILAALGFLKETRVATRKWILGITEELQVED